MARFSFWILPHILLRIACYELWERGKYSWKSTVNPMKYTISILSTTSLQYVNESTSSFSFQFFWMVDNSQLMQEMYKNTAFRIASKVLGKMYVLFFLPHCFMPFALLKHVYYLPGNRILIRVLRIFSYTLYWNFV